MRRPYIGIILLVDEAKESYWMLPGYMDGIEQAGGIPILLPLTNNEEVLKQVIYNIDGLLLTGGHDVDPSLYYEKAHAKTGTHCCIRDSSEAFLIKEAIKINLPTLGICRGLQLLNVVLGGSLYQDLPSQAPSDIQHQMSPPYNRTAHCVTISPNTPLSSILNAEKIGVNSYHHQAIKALAPSLQVAATSEDGLIEAVYLPEQRFTLAVQWHPELSYKENQHSLALFQAFVQACFKKL